MDNFCSCLPRSTASLAVLPLSPYVLVALQNRQNIRMIEGFGHARIDGVGWPDPHHEFEKFFALHATSPEAIEEINRVRGSVTWCPEG